MENISKKENKSFWEKGKFGEAISFSNSVSVDRSLFVGAVYIGFNGNSFQIFIFYF